MGGLYLLPDELEAPPRRRGSTLGSGEHGVRADTAPHHVRLALLDRLAVVKGRPSIGCPGHLVDPRSALNSSYPQARAETLSALEVLDELLYGLPKALLLVCGELVEVLLEPG
jgi:hypothetical protein